MGATVPLKLRIIFFGWACFWLALSTAIVMAQNVKFADFRNVGLISNDQGKLDRSRSKGALDPRLRQSRNAFFKALRSGQNLQSAWRTHEHNLTEKDLAHLLLIYLPAGTRSPQSQIGGLLGSVDGGVDRRTKALFENWVEPVRYHLGVRDPNAVGIPNPFTVGEILLKTQDRSYIYQRARTRSEIFASGVPAERLFSPETFVKILLEDLYALRGLRLDHLPTNHEYKRSNPEQVANDWYQILTLSLGEDKLLKAAQEVMRRPLDRKGKLRDRFTFAKPAPNHSVYTLHPLTMLISLATNSPQGYIVNQKRRKAKDWIEGFTQGHIYYQRLSAEHGQARVNEIARQVQNAPKTERNLLLDPTKRSLQSPLAWIEAMLADPSLPLPDLAKMDISAQDRLAIQDAEGTRRRVFGRIERIVWDKSAIQHVFELHFVGEGHVIGYVQREVDIWKRRHGQNMEQLIGKLVSIEGTVAPFQRGGWVVQAWTPNDIKLFEPSQWPKNLPTPRK